MVTNTWELGTLYIRPNGPNGYWTQTDGPFSSVLPAQVVQPNSTIAPFSTAPVTEQTGVMSFPCGHFVDEPMIYRDYDYVTKSSAAMVCCPMCSILADVVEPYEAWLNVITNPIQFP